MLAETVTLEKIEQARDSLKDLITRTPTHQAYSLSNKLGAQVYLKLETHQPIKVFKIRGALNKILHLTDEERRRGLITASAGNHGLGVAYGAKIYGLAATICVPENARPEKIAAIESLGAEVVRYGKTYNETFPKALEIQKKKGATLIHAFEDPHVIAGQGTIGLEIMEDVDDVDTIIVGIGGGGLISGIAIAVKSLKPNVKIIGVEPEGASSMYQSVRLGRHVRLEKINTIADGLAATEPGHMTLEYVKKHVDEILLVSDQEICDAIVTLLREERVLAEPAGAAALAALLYKHRPKLGEKIVLVVSGGNISMSLLKSLLNKEEERS